MTEDVFRDAELACDKQHGEIIREAIRSPEGASLLESYGQCGCEVLSYIDNTLHRNTQALEGLDSRIRSAQFKLDGWSDKDAPYYIHGRLGKRVRARRYNLEHKIDCLETRLEDKEAIQERYFKKLRESPPCLLPTCSACSGKYLDEWNKMFGPPTQEEVIEILEDLKNHG